jgi:hypothetical protein
MEVLQWHWIALAPFRVPVSVFYFAKVQTLFVETRHLLLYSHALPWCSLGRGQKSSRGTCRVMVVAFGVSLIWNHANHRRQLGLAMKQILEQQLQLSQFRSVVLMQTICSWKSSSSS